MPFIAVDLLIAGGSLVALFARFSYFETTLATLGLAAIYLTVQRVRQTGAIRRALLMAVVFMPFLVTIDYVAFAGRAWYITESLGPRMLHGSLPFEDIIWAALWVYVVYLLTSASHSSARVSPVRPLRVTLALGIEGLLLAVTLWFVGAPPRYLPYAYLQLTMIVVVALFVLRRSSLVTPARLRVYLHCTFVIFCLEVAGAVLHHWSFPGTYVGRLAIGPYFIPLEELACMVLLSAPLVVALADWLEAPVARG